MRRLPTDIRILALACGTVIALGAPQRVAAAPINFADDLECRDIRDSATHRKYTADFASNELPPQDGCVVQVPAKQVCWAVVNDGINPPALAAPAGPNLNGHYYLCYKMLCTKDETQYVLADKLGGARYVQLKRASRICVPGY